MIPKSQRLSTKELELVMKKGVVTQSPTLCMRVLRIEDGVRLGFSAIAPKSAFKTAVERNKVRRSVYDSMRPFINGLKHPIQACVTAKRPALKLGSTEMRAAMKDLFVKAGVLR